MDSDKDKLIKELVEENIRLYADINKIIHMNQELLELAKPSESLDGKLDRLFNEYITQFLFAKAKFTKDKRAALYLLKEINELIKKGKPITGACAEYLSGAIDQILMSPKHIDVKGAFLLNGTKSLSGRDTKIIQAIEAAIALGHRKHKAKGKMKDGAYLKVAKEFGMSPSSVESIYAGHSKKPDNNEFLNVRRNEVAKLMKGIIFLIENQRGMDEFAVINKIKKKFFG